MKVKVLMNQIYANQGAPPVQDTKGKDILSNVPQEEKVLRILQVHNLKVEKILTSFREQFTKR